MSVKCSEVVNYNLCLGYYRLISEMFEDQIKYITSYKLILNDYFIKVLNLQVNLGSKLGNLPESFSKAKWLNFRPILKMTEQIPKIIQKQIENQKTLIGELDKSLKNIEDFLKEKSNSIKNYQQKYEEPSSELIKKYIDGERIKTIFLNSINKTEDIIARYYYNKKKINDSKNDKINDNELKILFDKNKEYESQKKILINTTKKYEKEYNNIINNTVKYENKFLNIINECINGVKSISCDLTDKLNDILLTFFTSVRNSLKSPLEIIDMNYSYFKNINNREYMNKNMINTFNNESKLEHILPEKYNLKSLVICNSKDNDKDTGSIRKKLGKNKNIEENFYDNKKTGFIKFEDGLEEMTYFEEDYTLNTVKEMFINFELINLNGLDINIEIEEEKNNTKNYISKIISNMSYKNINNYYLEEEENNILLNLLNKHHNRIIFLHKLNDYRSSCKFELGEKEYYLLGKLFSYILNISRKEKDYHCVELIIILSKTYYILKDKKTKIYLQNFIIDNQCFKTKNFWEELLIYAVNKEVIKSNKREKINTKDENKLKTKNENIIFSQLLSLIDNMFDFGFDGQMIKNIIEPNIEYYKIANNLKKTISDVIESKIKKLNEKK